jgi:hypothetical protein
MALEGGMALASGITGNIAANRRARAAKRAAALINDAANQGIGDVRGQFDATKANLDPYVSGGLAGQQVYQNELMGGKYDAPQWQGVDMAQDPGAQYRMDQAQKAIQASAAARGGLLGGGTMRAINKESQGLASQEYGNAYNRASQDYARQYSGIQDRANRFMGLGQQGQLAANQLGGFGANMANQTADLRLRGAGAMAGGINDAANYSGQGLVGLVGAINKGIGNMGQMYGGSGMSGAQYFKGLGGGQ